MQFNKLPSYTYVAVKYHLLKLRWFQSTPKITILVSLFIASVIVPFITQFLLLVIWYRSCIDWILKFKLKPSYRGLMRGVDAICCNQERCTPSFHLLIDYEQSLDDLRNNLIDFLRNSVEHRHQKLFYSWDSFMGYHYFYKNELKYEDYVCIATTTDDNKTIRTKEEFVNVITQYDLAPMPDDDHALLHLIVYPQEVLLPGAEQTKLVCVKMHHALGDGKAILSWMMADLADKEKVQLVQENGHVANGNGVNGANGVNGVNGHASNGFIAKPLSKWSKFVGDIKETLLNDKIKIFPSEFQDDNILIGRNLREEKFVCWFSDYSAEYMDKIRTIRRLKPGVTFLDVINTCISSSLQEYYEKHSQDTPKTIGAGVVLSPANYSFRYGDTNFTLSNEFSAGGLHLPIGLNQSTNEADVLLEKLNFCQKEYQTIRDCIDVKFYYWLSDVFSLLPYQIPTFLTHRMMSLTVGISSLPGTDRKIKIFGGNLVKDIILMPPNSPGTALHFVICSYGKHLRLSLTIDKSVVEKFDDAQSIVDGVIRNLDKLHQIIDK